VKIRNHIVKFARDHRGMETVEWGILAALIVTGLVTVVALLGNQLLTKFTVLQGATS